MPLLVCPNCNVGMTNVQRDGVEIDICPQCRGVWLDRGELEKLLQPMRQEMQPQSVWGGQAPPPAFGHGPQHYDKHDEHHSEHGHDQWRQGHDGRHGVKKSGWSRFMDVFD